MVKLGERQFRQNVNKEFDTEMHKPLERLPNRYPIVLETGQRVNKYCMMKNNLSKSRDGVDEIKTQSCYENWLSKNDATLPSYSTDGLPVCIHSQLC